MELSDQERKWIEAIRSGAAHVVYKATPETCKHPRQYGSTSIGTGGFHSTWHCPDCGARGETSWPAPQEDERVIWRI